MAWRVFRRAFPIFLLALVAQLAAPAAMQADTLPAAPDCLAMAAGTNGERPEQPGNDHCHDAAQCCLFCHTPIAADPKGSGELFAAPAPLALYVAWAKKPASCPHAHRGVYIRARAPPLSTPPEEGRPCADRRKA